MRAITGVGAEGLTDAAAHITGAFFSSYAVKVGGFVGATETSAVYACANAFDSSRVVPTGPVRSVARMATYYSVSRPPGLSWNAEIQDNGEVNARRHDG